MAGGKAKSSKGIRRLSPNRKTRYAKYALMRPWEERKIRRVMKNNNVTRSVATGMIRKPGKKAGKQKIARDGS